MARPMPTATYEGQTYKLRSRNIEIPDLASMEAIAARVWLLQNAYARGTNYRRPKPNLAGLKFEVR